MNRIFAFSSPFVWIAVATILAGPRCQAESIDVRIVAYKDEISEGRMTPNLRQCSEWLKKSKLADGEKKYIDYSESAGPFEKIGHWANNRSESLEYNVHKLGPRIECLSLVLDQKWIPTAAILCECRGTFEIESEDTFLDPTLAEVERKR